MTPKNSALIFWLSENNIQYRTQVNIAKFSQIKAGGLVELMIYPKGIIELQRIVKNLKVMGLGHQIIGNLSNVIFRDGPIVTPFLNLSKMRGITLLSDNSVMAEAGVMMPTFARHVIDWGYGGVAGLVGVPGTVGGGIFMNASCYGSEISEFLVSVACIDSDGRAVTLSKNELNFSWRKSAFHQAYRSLIIVSALFSLPRADAAQQRNLVTKISEHRKRFQEKSRPNLGSLFATRDIYNELANYYFFYKGLLFLPKISAKIFRKNRDERYACWARRLTLLYFCIKPSRGVGFSDSTFNCVCNVDDASADEIIRTIEAAEKAIKFKVPLENEIVKEIS